MCWEARGLDQKGAGVVRALDGPVTEAGGSGALGLLPSSTPDSV